MLKLVKRILWRKLVGERQVSVSTFEADIAWLAVRSESLELVTRALDYTPRQVADWKEAVLMLGKHPSYLFVYGSVQGWILVLGAHSLYSRSNLENLSTKFGEVQYFETRAVRQYYHWAIFREGTCVRTYSYEPETTLHIEGEATEIEQEFALPQSLDDTTNTALDHPNEYMLYEIAASWSIDPVAAYDAGLFDEKGWVCW